MSHPTSSESATAGSLASNVSASAPAALSRVQAAPRGARGWRRLWGGALAALSRLPTWVARLHFGLFSGALGREQRGVLSGIFTYHAAEKRHGSNRFLLRRNTHRVEKGLLMRPRKPTFGMRYIEETIAAYETYVATFAGTCSAGQVEEWRWAHDVLAEYFAVSAAHPVIDGLAARFRRLPKPPVSATRSSPYQRDLSAPPVGYEALRRLAHQRRSVRFFQDRPVPRQLIDQALELAFEAPSACNRQPFQFRIFDDRARAQQLLSIPAGTRGWVEQVPVAIAVVGQLRAFFAPQDRHLIYIDSSLAVMGFMYALETLGLSSCPVNFPDAKKQEKMATRFLGLAPDERVIMLMAVGYPDPQGEVAFSHKRALDELRTYEA